MGYDPQMVQEIPSLMLTPKEALTWVQIAYYTIGGLAGLAGSIVAWRKVASIFKNRRKHESKSA